MQIFMCICEQWDLHYDFHPLASTVHLSILHLPNLIYTFKEIPVKIPASYYLEITKLVLKFIWKDKRSRTANITLNKNKVRGLTLLNLKIYL